MKTSCPDLSNVPLGNLVSEIRRRSRCSLIVLQLHEDHVPAGPDVRVLMQADETNSLQLLGVATLAHADVLNAVRSRMSNPPSGEPR